MIPVFYQSSRLAPQEKNRSIRYLRHAAAALCLVNIVFIGFNLEPAFDNNQQRSFVASAIFTVLLLLAYIFNFVRAFNIHRWIRFTSGLVLLTLGVYSVVALASSIDFSRDPETNQVCNEYGGNTKTCALLSVQTLVLVIMCLVLSAEIWVTLRVRTTEIKTGMAKAEEDREDMESESRRMRAVMEEHRNRQQEQYLYGTSEQ